MENFNFYSPTDFVFGKGTENVCGKYVKAISVMLLVSAHSLVSGCIHQSLKL